MKLYKIIDEEKIEVTPDISLFESVNTHSGDEQEIFLSLSKDKEVNIKNLMCELSIVDNDEIYKLKKNTVDDNSIYYFRTLTGKTMSFKLYAKQDDNYILLKPDKDGVFYVERNWVLDEEIVLKLELNCEENFSEKFGENKFLKLELNFLGDTSEEKTYV